MLPPHLQVCKILVELCDSLGIEYLLSGSVASSLLGQPRFTNDVDMVMDLRPEHVTPFVVALQGAFYVDEEMIHEAIQSRSSCNVIHLPTMVKVDIYLYEPTPWKQSEWARRSLQNIGVLETPLLAQLPSVEDMVLQKLFWYRLGGGVSDRQWNDILGMLKVQSNTLDRNYLTHWATELQLTELLHHALEDAEQGDG